jgi:predicted AAA+ superfamily ATPase
MRNLSPARLHANRTPFGSLLETFVLSELLKLASWSGGRFEFFHFRDRYDNEVDIVIEDQDGQVVGIRSRHGDAFRRSDVRRTYFSAVGSGEGALTQPDSR